jgi:hypothetical protein
VLHRPPAAAFLPGRVDRDAVVQLDYLTATPGRGAPSPSCESCRASGLRLPGRAGGPAASQLWVFVGILVGGDATCVMMTPSLPAFVQVRGLMRIPDL